MCDVVDSRMIWRFNTFMRSNPDALQDALRVAKLYYYGNLTTQQIAEELDYSRPKVSRLLSLAREHGLVEIKVREEEVQLEPLGNKIRTAFGLSAVHIVSVPPVLGELIWLQRVAQFTANYLNTILRPHSVVGIAWGTTMSEVSVHLVPRKVDDLSIVQLNGSGNTYVYDNSYAAQILHNFATNYQARMYLFPVPTFFDYPETKAAMWRERSIRTVVEMQQRADVFLFSIGAVSSGVPSHVHSGGYLEQNDLEVLKRERVVGDLATVFFRADGTFEGLSINKRASGPPLDLFRSIKRTVCVVSGLAKAAGLLAALRAGYIKDLIVDEQTARALSSLMDEASGDGHPKNQSHHSQKDAR